jgi:hypothetical protein
MTPSERLAAASPEVKAAALELLDAVSAPMHPRNIEKALCRGGFTRSQARPVVKVLKHLPIIYIGSGQPGR